MSRAQALLSTLILLVVSSIAMAQSESAKLDKGSSATISAYASGERVRFAAQSEVVQIRLEVYNSAGSKLFDDEVRGGNVLDWHLRDGQAAPLADDSYLCVVKVKSLSGRITQRIGLVTVERSTARLQPVDTSQMTRPQAQAIGPIEDNASLTLLKDDESRTTTVIAHDGEEGQITRGRGSLTFRIGDFFSGRDTEQMRLTPEGNLGIGITHPHARLDVDGLIRASQGIIFPDGSVQYSAARRTFGAASLRPSQSGKTPRSGQDFEAQTFGGSGTPGKIAKWTASDTLGDSVIAEQGGVALFGTTTQINPNHVVSILAQPPKTPLTLAGGSGAMEFWKDTAGQNGLPTKAAAFGMATPGQASTDDMVFSAWDGSSWSERMRMTNGGNLSVSGVINTSTQYNIAGNRVLSVTGAGPSSNSNTFVGVNSGSSNTPGNNGFDGNLNTFFGFNTGNNNTTGAGNTILGAYAGYQTTTGSGNTFLGDNAGRLNGTGQANTFVGEGAGLFNTGGFGLEGSSNTFVGESAGNANTTGGVNSFFGQGAGVSNTVGNANSFFGYNAGITNINGSYNTLLGYLADGFGAQNATAVGAYARVTQNNSLVLGAINGVNGASADTLVGIGTTAPAAKLHVSGGAILLDNNQGLYWKSNGGAQKRVLLADTIDTLHIGSGGGLGFDQMRFDLATPGTVMTMLSSGNVGIGTTAPATKLHVGGGAILLDNNQGFFLNDTTGAQKRVLLADTLNRLHIGSGGTSGFDEIRFDLATPGTVMTMVSTGDVGIGTVPVDKLQVAGDIRIGKGTTGCVKDADGTVIAGACSSDARFKRDITPFPRLLDRLVRLQPVHFYWDTKARPDRAFGDSVSFGLVAQEVEKVMPELVTEDEQGFKAVRYNKLPLLTLQAIKELKEDNDSLRRSNNRLESHVAALKRLVCLDHPDADVCRPR